MTTTMTTVSVPSSSGQEQQPYLRLATIDDLEEIVDCSSRAFIHDPLMNYCNNVKKMLEFDMIDRKACADCRAILYFHFKTGFLIGGRITVIVDPSQSDHEGNKRDRIIASAMWLPPQTRLAGWKVPTMVKAGIIPLLKGWGLTGWRRNFLEYKAKSESKMRSLFKEAGLKKSPDDSWYLQVIFTDSEYQGKGMMSQLIREAFAHSSEGIFTLEASTPKSRDQYAHLGFELSTSITFGEGKADERGIAASGSDANGFEIWMMAKVPSNLAVGGK